MIRNGDVVFLVNQDQTKNAFLKVCGGHGEIWTCERMRSSQGDPKGVTRKWKITSEKVAHGQPLPNLAEVQFHTLYQPSGWGWLTDARIVVERAGRQPASRECDVFGNK